MKLYVKNMVCQRCKLAVADVLGQLGYRPHSINLGEVELEKPPLPDDMPKLQNKLQALGFELIDDRKSRIIEKVKVLVIDLVHHRNSDLNIKLSYYLSEQTGKDYSAISNLFSEVEGITIEQFFIEQRIEKVKELLLYEEHSIGEIADILGFSSAAHLSNQFRKITGLSPSHYRSVKENKRRQIGEL